MPTPRQARRLHCSKVRGTSCNADKTDSTLDELMRSRSSSTGNLTDRDTLAGGGAAVAGVNLIGGDTLAILAGRNRAISYVKRLS